MLRTRLAGRSEIVGPAHVGKDEVEAAIEGGGPEVSALRRRCLSTSGYNGHWRYLVRGEGDRYAQMVAAAKKAGTITEGQFEKIFAELVRSVGPTFSANPDSARKILRENLNRSGVKISRA